MNKVFAGRAQVALVTAALLLCAAVAVFVPLRARAQHLGTIAFPTSGLPAAQPAFLEGVKDLHSFQFDEAAAAFQKVTLGDTKAYRSA